MKLIVFIAISYLSLELFLLKHEKQLSILDEFSKINNAWKLADVLFFFFVEIQVEHLEGENLQVTPPSLSIFLCKFSTHLIIFLEI